MPYKQVCRSRPAYLPQATFSQGDALKRRRDRRRPKRGQDTRAFTTCTKCRAPLLSKNLARHLAEVHHEGDRPYHFCPECPYSSYRVEDVRRHTRTAHPQELLVNRVQAEDAGSSPPCQGVFPILFPICRLPQPPSPASLRSQLLGGVLPFLHSATAASCGHRAPHPRGADSPGDGVSSYQLARAASRGHRAPHPAEPTARETSP